jgi:transcriptional regulator with XRE-family HTH domain
MSDSPLRAYRAKSGLTLERIGAEFGVHKTTILRWEEGHLPAERVLLLAKFTGLTPQELRPDLYPPPEQEAVPT